MFNGSKLKPKDMQIDVAQYKPRMQREKDYKCIEGWCSYCKELKECDTIKCPKRWGQSYYAKECTLEDVLENKIT